MKFNKSGQLFLVSAAALLVSGLLSACLVTNTADFVFVASSKAAGPNNYGQIDVMEVNAQSGLLRPIPTSPFPSQGRNPVAEVVSPDGNYLYVVNQDDKSIVEFQIGNDGKVYAQSTINTLGLAPVALAIDPAQKFLYVIDTYQPSVTCNSADPCAGAVEVYDLLPGTPGSVSTSAFAGANGPCQGAPSGAPCLDSNVINSSSGVNYYTLTINSDVVTPQGITVLANGSGLYVTALDSTNSFGCLFQFTASSGILYPAPFQYFVHAGTNPTGIVSSSDSSTLFIADTVNLSNAPAGNILVYNISSGPILTPVGSYPAGNQPIALALSPSGAYLFAANQLDGNLTTFSVAGPALTNLGTSQTGTQPSAVLVDPNLGQFVYVTNFLGSNGVGTVSGYALNPANGGLISTVNQPFTVNALPTAMAAIPHKFK